jgi:hypothetical protein
MKTHYGLVTEDYYDENTPCGLKDIGDEIPLSTDWEMISCKKCLKMKDRIIAGIKADEEVIVKQMGDFVKFVEREEKILKEK